jgi:hypothetical protein
MALPNIFSTNVAEKIIARIEALSTSTQPKWGKMNVAQMLAHCNVTYEMCYENKYPKPGAFKRFILTALIKKTVTNEKPYSHNSRTAPEFLIVSEKDFAEEKSRLIGYIQKTVELGGAAFNMKESHSFGKLTTEEWNNMFYKHLDHHLTQFGV